MANRSWLVAGVFAIAFIVACNSDKPSPFATKSSAAGSSSSSSAAAGSAASGSAASGSGSATVAPASGDVAFKVGDVVWSLWANGYAYRGKIVGINEDGSYQIVWDDGHGRNDRWAAERVKRDKPAENPMKVGDRVWSRPDMWEDNHARQGKILRINADGTYRMSWDDTDDTNTQKEWLSHDKPAPLPKKPAVSSKASSSGKPGDKPCPEGPGWTRCKDWGCQKLSTSNQHCGACGHGCRADQTCNDGVCGCHSYEHLDENGRCSS